MEYDLQHWQSSQWSKGTRYYCIELYQNLFGDWVIRRSWGRNNTIGAGKLKTVVFDNREDALELYHKQTLRRLKRGYVQHQSDKSIRNESEFSNVSMRLITSVNSSNQSK